MSYPSDLTDVQWEMIAPHFDTGNYGKSRKHDKRHLINGVLYQPRFFSFEKSFLKVFIMHEKKPDQKIKTSAFSDLSISLFSMSLKGGVQKKYAFFTLLHHSLSVIISNSCIGYHNNLPCNRDHTDFLLLSFFNKTIIKL